MLEIETASFPAPWHRASFEGLLLEDTSWALAIKQARGRESYRLVAYIFFSLIDDKMHVLNLAVDSPFRRHGVATLLLQRSMTLARKHGIKYVCLEVRPSNHPAIEFYGKMGFCEKGRKSRYYLETQEDAIIMAKDITTQSIMEGL